MVQPLILQYYQLLPERRHDEDPVAWPKKFPKGLARFKTAVEARYNESTLQRLLGSQTLEVRQAAILALGMVGANQANSCLVKCLRDEDLVSRQLADQALRAVWQRSDTPDNNRELQRLIGQIGSKQHEEETLRGFEALVRKAPRFAEAFNQRAIFYFVRGNYSKAIHDFEKALRLNPFHFAAAAGMGQCFMKQKKLRAALRIYRRTNRINPNLSKVRETIASLERMLGEEGKK